LLVCGGGVTLLFLSAFLWSIGSGLAGGASCISLKMCRGSFEVCRSALGSKFGLSSGSVQRVLGSLAFPLLVSMVVPVIGSLGIRPPCSL